MSLSASQTFFTRHTEHRAARTTMCLLTDVKVWSKTNRISPCFSNDFWCHVSWCATDCVQRAFNHCCQSKVSQFQRLGPVRIFTHLKQKQANNHFFPLQQLWEGPWNEAGNTWRKFFWQEYHSFKGSKYLFRDFYSTVWNWNNVIFCLCRFWQTLHLLTEAARY